MNRIFSYVLKDSAVKFQVRFNKQKKKPITFYEKSGNGYDLTIPPRPPDTSTSSNHFTLRPVIN